MSNDSDWEDDDGDVPSSVPSPSTTSSSSAVPPPPQSSSILLIACPINMSIEPNPSPIPCNFTLLFDPPAASPSSSTSPPIGTFTALIYDANRRPLVLQQMSLPSPSSSHTPRSLSSLFDFHILSSENLTAHWRPLLPSPPSSSPPPSPSLTIKFDTLHDLRSVLLIMNIMMGRVGGTMGGEKAMGGGGEGGRRGEKERGDEKEKEKDKEKGVKSGSYCKFHIDLIPLVGLEKLSPSVISFNNVKNVLTEEMKQIKNIINIMENNYNNNSSSSSLSLDCVYHFPSDTDTPSPYLSSPSIDSFKEKFLSYLLTHHPSSTSPPCDFSSSFLCRFLYKMSCGFQRFFIVPHSAPIVEDLFLYAKTANSSSSSPSASPSSSLYLLIISPLESSKKRDKLKIGAGTLNLNAIFSGEYEKITMDEGGGGVGGKKKGKEKEKKEGKEKEKDKEKEKEKEGKDGNPSPSPASTDSSSSISPSPPPPPTPSSVLSSLSSISSSFSFHSRYSFKLIKSLLSSFYAQCNEYITNTTTSSTTNSNEWGEGVLSEIQQGMRKMLSEYQSTMTNGEEEGTAAYYIQQMEYHQKHMEQYTTLYNPNSNPNPSSPISPSPISPSSSSSNSNSSVELLKLTKQLRDLQSSYSTLQSTHSSLLSAHSTLSTDISTVRANLSKSEGEVKIFESGLKELRVMLEKEMEEKIAIKSQYSALVTQSSKLKLTFVNDKFVQFCMNATCHKSLSEKKLFTLFSSSSNNKTLCQSCGRIYCGDCCKKEILLGEIYGERDREKRKVCNPCEEMWREWRKGTGTGGAGGEGKSDNGVTANKKRAEESDKNVKGWEKGKNEINTKSKSSAPQDDYGDGTNGVEDEDDDFHPTGIDNKGKKGSGYVEPKSVDSGFDDLDAAFG